MRRFYENILDSCGMKNVLGAKLPYGVTVTERTACLPDPADADTGTGDCRGAMFVMNFKNEPVFVECAGEWTDAENGEEFSGKIRLEAFGCKVLLSRKTK